MCLLRLIKTLWTGGGGDIEGLLEVYDTRLNINLNFLYEIFNLFVSSLPYTGGKRVSTYTHKASPQWTLVDATRGCVVCRDSLKQNLFLFNYLSEKKNIIKSRGGVDSLTFNRSLLTRICCTFIFGHLPLQIILGIELCQLLMQTSVIKWCTSFTFNGNDLSVIMTNNTDQINRSSYLSDDVNQQM